LSTYTTGREEKEGGERMGSGGLSGRGRGEGVVEG